MKSCLVVVRGREGRSMVFQAAMLMAMDVEIYFRARKDLP